MNLMTPPSRDKTRNSKPRSSEAEHANVWSPIFPQYCLFTSGQVTLMTSQGSDTETSSFKCDSSKRSQVYAC